MAQEIQVQVRIAATKDGIRLVEAGPQGPLFLDLDGEHGAAQTMVVTEAVDVAIPVPADIATIGALYLRNLDGENFIELSYGTGGGFAAGVFAIVRPGWPMLIQPSSATIYAKADTADCRIERAVLPE